jgi:hypothetical protein
MRSSALRASDGALDEIEHRAVEPPAPSGRDDRVTVGAQARHTTR